MGKISPRSKDYKFRKCKGSGTRAAKRVPFFNRGNQPDDDEAELRSREPKYPVEIAGIQEVGLSRVCYGYTRCSTTMQDQETTTQKHFISERYERQLKKEGYSWGGFFVDAAVTSGVNFLDRVSGGELIKVLKRGDAVIVDKWDRAFRNMLDYSQTLKIWMDCGIRVISLDLGIDATSTEGQLVSGIMAMMSQEERRRIRTRIRDTAHVRKMNGLLHSSRRPHGFKVDKKGKLTPWPEEREIMSHVVDMRQLDWSFARIAAALTEEGIKRPPGRGAVRTYEEWNFKAAHEMYYCEIGLRLIERAVAEGRPARDLRAYRVGWEFVMEGIDLTKVERT